MNLLLLGNGFDLYHSLPTKYDNFLHVVDFLNNFYNSHMLTIGDVFKESKLHEKDIFLTECYNRYQNAYDSIFLDIRNVEKLIQLGQTNIWFKYFLNTFNKDVGWIDFEKEISFVITNIKKFLTNISTQVRLSNAISEEHFIIKQFNFFLTPLPNNDYYTNSATYKIKDKYIYEYPLGSRKKVVNKSLIIAELNSQLKDFAKMLKLYLKCFVDNSLERILQEKQFSKCKAIANIDKVITFNYTNTYEKMYVNKSIFHIHGNVDSKIILGLNPDSSDELSSIDTDFVCFKKYYQRMQYETDVEYINFVKNLNTNRVGYYLTVMGHSLDETDKDIIIELFKNMNEITILYHDENAKISYISNLLKIFGKEELDDLRKRRNLKFVSLNSNLDEYAFNISEKNYSDFMRQAAEFLRYQ